MALTLRDDSDDKATILRNGEFSGTIYRDKDDLWRVLFTGEKMAEHTNTRATYQSKAAAFEALRQAVEPQS